MPTFLIGYDLKTPGQKYETLYEAIKSYGNWASVMDSTWMVSGANLTAASVYAKLRTTTDDGDLLPVNEISRATSSGMDTPRDVGLVQVTTNEKPPVVGSKESKPGVFPC
jgi:hypothetical protein